jgi:hypothetical protein
VSHNAHSETGLILLSFPSVGCQCCIRCFRDCNAHVTPETYGWGYESLPERRLGWYYQLPSERLHADPPLSHEAAQWLAGKRERRLRFVQDVKKGREGIIRVPDCASITRENRYRGANSNRRTRTVRGCSLDGASVCISAAYH